jgi:hypothetical protein
MVNRIYKLSTDERKLAEELGRRRNDAKPPSIRNKMCGYSDPAFAHILGICSEIAYAKITNKKIDEKIYLIGDEFDFYKIEIKTSTWKGSDIELKIKVKEFERKNPMAYILARIDKEYTTVEFIGSITRQKFDVIKYKKHHKFVDNYCVSAEQLTKGLAFIHDGKVKFTTFN